MLRTSLTDSAAPASEDNAEHNAERRTGAKPVDSGLLDCRSSPVYRMVGQRILVFMPALNLQDAAADFQLSASSDGNPPKISCFCCFVGTCCVASYTVGLCGPFTSEFDRVP